MKKMKNKIMIFTLMLSTVMVMNSENWFSMWMGLEINMISFIPLIEENKKTLSASAKMNYFLIQSLGSMMFMFTMINTPMMIINEMYFDKMNSIMISMSMMLKMGAAPFHMWFIEIMQKINWNNCLILMTWQKIAPFIIVSNINMNNNMIKLCAIMSAMIGSISGINQTSTKKIMAFSSITNISWMLICIMFNNEMWMKYIIMYSIMVLMMTSFFKKNSIFYINQINSTNLTTSNKIIIIISIMSLGGMPPFLGFITKWIVIQALMEKQMMIIMTIMIMMSMITLYYYMKMVSPLFMSFNYTSKWNLSKNIKDSFYKNIMINIMLPLMMIINMN